MQRWLIPLIMTLMPLLLVFTLPLPHLLWAQTPGPTVPASLPPGWEQVAAALLNMLLSLLLAKLGAWAIPALRERYPVVLPILTAVLGAVVAGLQSWLGQMSGASGLTLSPTFGAFAGASAVALAQIPIQWRRMRARGLLTQAGAPL